jgi:inosine-uridine nucleoside N-ribohydrolase
MILFTDIGKDIDDAVALVYAIIAKVPITTIVTTSKDSHKAANITQNIIQAMSVKYPNADRIKVMYGSTKPIMDGLNHGVVYDGPFCQGYFTLNRYEAYKIKPEFRDRYDVAIVISPLTDLVSLLHKGPLSSIIFMGLPKEKDNELSPDMNSYNFKCDPYASDHTFEYQKQIPFAFIGKDCAYKVPFTKTDFNTIGDIDHPVAKFLKDHAFQTYEHFKTSVPELYEKVYKGTDNMSYCYDPLTMLSITNSELFTFRNVGQHKIATDVDGVKAKEVILNTIKEGLGG